jgi:RNA polymerase sigma-70 factor (ECF subfamily)
MSANGVAPDAVPLRWEDLREIAYRQARWWLRDHDDALDASQVTMVRLVFAVASGRTPDNPEAWVRDVTSKVVNSELRRRYRQPKNHIPMGAQAREATADEVGDGVVARMIFDEYLDGLSPQQQKALRLRFGADLTQATVGEVMGIKLETVRTHVDRARQAIRREHQLPRDEEPRKS